ncbi:hypothetical protein GCM10010515_20030 [Streptomyces fructofermentans]|uniref:Uncharacterized protein n=1 Tax=Streptomyces fructofermentans TaxID=152141 RepID=A0A918K9E9_9ACTN|nr:hypothetical protein GCM10010515_20030 [Streptomyces fructofermentans]
MSAPGPAPGRAGIRRTGSGAAGNLDYDVSFVLVVTRVVDTVPAGPGTLLPGTRRRGAMARPAAAGDHCSRSGTDTYDGSAAGEEKVSCAPVGLCSM